jgi:site-specific recombinase XerD
MLYTDIAEVNEFLKLKEFDKSPQTLRSYRLSLAKFFEYFKFESFDDVKTVTASKVRDYMGYLLSLGTKKNSVNAYIRPIKAFYNWLVENEYTEKSPLAKIKELKAEEVDRQFFSYDEIDAMIKACDLEDKVILTILLTTGIRRGELCGIKLEDFKGDHIVIRRETTKSKKQRIYALAPEVADLLDEYIEYRSKRFGDCSEYLLLTKMRAPFSGEAIRERLIGICRRAGFSEERLKQVHVHMTRHTFAANFMEEVGDIKILQAALGHAQMNTTEKIYAHIRNTALDNAMLSMRSILPRK